MAFATFTLRRPVLEPIPSPRDARAAAAPALRLPPRVYSPFRRRTVAPMAVPLALVGRTPGRRGLRRERG